MSLLFLLQLISSFEGLWGAEHETVCSSNACFTIHMEPQNFEKARENCQNNGGHLMTVRDRQEEDILRSLFSLIQTEGRDEVLQCWIGLKLSRQDCVFPNQPLRGFKWISGDEESNYSNWKKEPKTTCTSDRCVTVDYTSDLKWTPGNCRDRAFYACKFYFNGTCRPLVLLGSGRIIYTVPFSTEPQKRDMKSFPYLTYANIFCDDNQTDYTVCVEVDGSYGWNNWGPFCPTGTRTCDTNNGGCEHQCQQDRDSVQCFCKNGYELEDNGLTCRITELCSLDTCEYKCVMTESGFICKCPPGFKLHQNQRNCSDVDECQTQSCRDHVCTNTHGSYTCACRDGYKMEDEECVDVDECAPSRCEHTCINTIGSFFCRCSEGFTLSQDGRSCVEPQGFGVNRHGPSSTPHVTTTSAMPSSINKEETPENITESLTSPTVELQHQTPQTSVPPLNVTVEDQQINASTVMGSAKAVSSKVIICVLGSVVPLMALVAATVFIAVFRCHRSKREVKKTTADGYCWVSSGLDPRLEKFYESILTDDL
ncbi:complement component C1q receptor-like [Pholidichthys leucotaenia]